MIGSDQNHHQCSMFRRLDDPERCGQMFVCVGYLEGNLHFATVPKCDGANTLGGVGSTCVIRTSSCVNAQLYWACRAINGVYYRYSAEIALLVAEKRKISLRQWQRSDKKFDWRNAATVCVTPEVSLHTPLFQRRRSRRYLLILLSLLHLWKTRK